MISLLIDSRPTWLCLKVLFKEMAISTHAQVQVELYDDFDRIG